MKRLVGYRQQSSSFLSASSTWNKALRSTSSPTLQWTTSIRRSLHGAVPLDGNAAAAHVAYGLSELHSIFPITPSSTMSELADKWSSEGKPNAFGTVPKVVEMQVRNSQKILLIMILIILLIIVV